MTRCFGLLNTTACLLFLRRDDTSLLSHANAQAFFIAHTSALQFFLLMQKKVATNKRTTQKSPNHDGSEHRTSFFRTNMGELGMGTGRQGDMM